MDTPIIELRGVHKRFGRTVVLDGADLSIFKGDTTTIIGKSGGGKSVLLKHIIGLIEPDGGQVLFNGTPVNGLRGQERQAFKKKFSYMFQNMALFDSLTVFDNIALPLREKTSLSEKEIADKVSRIVQQLEIAEVTTKYPSQISGGMMKRVALARALITDPEIILFDEPTTGLDPLRKNAVLSLISHYQKKFGYTSIVVSHDIPDVFYISNRVAMLENGKIVFQGTPAEIQMCNEPAVQEFIRSHEALKDELTGFDTKKRLEYRFKQESCRCEYGQGGFSIAIFRIEGLGLIVERLGATAGQRFIQDFADLVRQHTRPIDISARYSRNEIITVMPCMDGTAAGNLCERLAQSLRGRDLLGDKDVPYSIQAGTAEAGAESQIEEVVALAEATMSVLVNYGRKNDSSGDVAHSPTDEQTSTAERP